MTEEICIPEALKARGDHGTALLLLTCIGMKFDIWKFIKI